MPAERSGDQTVPWQPATMYVYHQYSASPGLNIFRPVRRESEGYIYTYIYIVRDRENCHVLTVPTRLAECPHDPAQQLQGYSQLHRGCRFPHAVCYPRAECPRLQPHLLRPHRQEAGHRPHHRARAGLHPTRHHGRLRRQPYLYPWRLRLPCLWHWYQRGRACPRYPDADHQAQQEHEGSGGW